jgi:hypothetical protein
MFIVFKSKINKNNIKIEKLNIFSYFKIYLILIGEKASSLGKTIG